MRAIMWRLSGGTRRRLSIIYWLFTGWELKINVLGNIYRVRKKQLINFSVLLSSTQVRPPYQIRSSEISGKIQR